MSNKIFDLQPNFSIQDTFLVLLRKLSLQNRSRYIFTKNEINSIILSMSNKKLKDIKDVTIANNITTTITMTKAKQAMLAKHTKQYILNPIIFLNDKDKLCISKMFFELLESEISNKIEENKLTTDETDDSDQGFLYISPTSKLDKTSLLFEKTFTDTKFTEDMILAKNSNNFSQPESSSELGSKSLYPKKMSVQILQELSLSGTVQSLAYEIERDGYIYSRYNSELLSLTPNTKIVPDGYYSDDKDVPKVSVAELKNYAKEQIKYYVYDAIVRFPDGTNVPIAVESFVPLRQTLHTIYGYVLKGTVSSLQYVKAFAVEEDSSTNLTIDNILDTANSKHAFFQLYNFLFNHVRNNNVKMIKKRSDTIFWMETLKTLVQFGGFDPDKRVHSIYSGFQDVGKSYVINKFNSIKFANVKIVEPSRMSGPGLFGAANRNVSLPNETLTGVMSKGAFTGDAVFIEEVGKGIQDKKSIFNNNIEAFKLNLFSRETENILAGGGRQPRNAYLSMTMNYDTDWLQYLRKQLLLTTVEIQKDNNLRKAKNFGEQTDTDVLNSKINSLVLTELIMKYDIFMDIENYTLVKIQKEVDKNIDKYENINSSDDIDEETVLMFKKSIRLFRENMRGKNIYTSLPNNFMKRLLFSLFGETNETRVDKSDDELDKEVYKKNYNSNDLSEIQRDKDLYISNLQELIYNHSIGNATRLGYISDNPKNPIVARQNSFAVYIFNFFLKTYANFSETLGDQTVQSTISQVLNTLMYFNGEERPSLETLQIIEKWIYLQCCAISTKEAKSYVQLENKIQYKMNENNYPDIVKDFKKIETEMN